MNRQPEIKYFNNLDGLRFLAAFAVIIGHCQSLLYERGVRVYSPYADKLANFGVDFFFVLSGFLISYLLLREIDKTGTIHIRFFYYRRFLRIWPVYFGFGLLGLAVGKFFIDLFNYHPEYSHDYSLKDFFYNTFFLGTFSINFQAMLGYHRPVSSLMVGHFWSLAIEEQFYLIWAPMMFLFRKHAWVLIVIFISIGWYFNNIPIEKVSQYTEFHINFTANRFLHFGLGAALAWIIRYLPLVEANYFAVKTLKNQLFVPYLDKITLKKYLLNRQLSEPQTWVYILTLVIQIWFLWKSSMYLFGEKYPLNERIINGFVSIGIIATAILPWSALTLLLLETKPLKYLGKISFGIYIYHFMAIHLADKLLEVFGINVGDTNFYFMLPIISSVFAVAAAAVSFEYFEKYFLTLKTKFHS